MKILHVIFILDGTKISYNILMEQMSEISLSPKTPLLSTLQVKTY